MQEFVDRHHNLRWVRIPLCGPTCTPYTGATHPSLLAQMEPNSGDHGNVGAKNKLQAEHPVMSYTSKLFWTIFPKHSGKAKLEGHHRDHKQRTKSLQSNQHWNSDALIFFSSALGIKCILDAVQFPHTAADLKLVNTRRQKTTLRTKTASRNSGKQP